MYVYIYIYIHYILYKSCRLIKHSSRQDLRQTNRHLKKMAKVILSLRTWACGSDRVRGKPQMAGTQCHC